MRNVDLRLRPRPPARVAPLPGQVAALPGRTRVGCVRRAAVVPARCCLLVLVWLPGACCGTVSGSGPTPSALRQTGSAVAVTVKGAASARARCWCRGPPGFHPTPRPEPAVRRTPGPCVGHHPVRGPAPSPAVRQGVYGHRHSALFGRVTPGRLSPVGPPLGLPIPGGCTLGSTRAPGSGVGGTSPYPGPAGAPQPGGYVGRVRLVRRAESAVSVGSAAAKSVARAGRLRI